MRITCRSTASRRFTVTAISDPGAQSKEPKDWEAKNKEVSQCPGVFLAAYVWGTNGRRFASLSDSERNNVVIPCVRMLHDKNEQYLEEIVHWCWDSQASPGGGAFAFFAPGDQTRYQAALCEPVLNDSGRPRILFAGEHLAVIHGWIQGAMQTALAAVRHFLGSN